MPHSIRLHGPWQCLRHSPAGGGTSSVELRVTVPADGSAPWDSDGLGLMELVRPFQQPTNLTDESVTLVICGPWDGGATAVELNGTALGRIADGAPARFPIRELLQPHNRLRLLIEPQASRLPTEVRLEIEEPPSSCLR